MRCSHILSRSTSPATSTVLSSDRSAPVPHPRPAPVSRWRNPAWTPQQSVHTVFGNDWFSPAARFLSRCSSWTSAECFLPRLPDLILGTKSINLALPLYTFGFNRTTPLFVLDFPSSFFLRALELTTFYFLIFTFVGIMHSQEALQAFLGKRNEPGDIDGQHGLNVGPKFLQARAQVSWPGLDRAPPVLIQLVAAFVVACAPAGPVWALLRGVI